MLGLARRPSVIKRLIVAVVKPALRSQRVPVRVLKNVWFRLTRVSMLTAAPRSKQKNIANPSVLPANKF